VDFLLYRIFGRASFEANILFGPKMSEIAESGVALQTKRARMEESNGSTDKALSGN